MEKYALITGASGGIGSAIAEKMVKEGYGVILHYYQNEAAVNKLASYLRSYTDNIMVVQGDLSSKEGVDHFLSTLVVPVDLLIYNGGQSLSALMMDVTDERIEEMVYLSVTALYRIAKFVLPKMIQKRTGNIIVISSIWGLEGASYEVLYSTVKGAQNTFVKALAKEVALSKIRVNGIAPGAILTNMLSDYTQEDLEMMEQEIPMGRIGKPSEIADAVAYLASDQSSYITGQILSVDGGWHT
ncbi:elongation factor P 5-aminopentanone reductase [Priestia flexa]|uniref:elongation factor P 5-aminopentanone reductase n=1 Tax=Priestia flexa TaxID=86664 RepID=UPI001B319350|nr:SDR family oxidoreductase [Priestia flexa]